MRIVKTLGLCVMLTTAAPLAQSQPLNTLCSYITSVNSFGLYACLFPGVIFPVQVKFAVGQYSSYPFLKGQMSYNQLKLISFGSNGVCGISTDVMPLTQTVVSTNGSGPDFNTYTQNWQGEVAGWAVFPILPINFIPVPLTFQWTDTVSNRAYGCCQ